MVGSESSRERSHDKKDYLGGSPIVTAEQQQIIT